MLYPYRQHVMGPSTARHSTNAFIHRVPEKASYFSHSIGSARGTWRTAQSQCTPSIRSSARRRKLHILSTARTPLTFRALAKVRPSSLTSFLIGVSRLYIPSSTRLVAASSFLSSSLRVPGNTYYQNGGHQEKDASFEAGEGECLGWEGYRWEWDESG